MKNGLLNNKNAQRGPKRRDARINIRVLESDKAEWQRVAHQNEMTLVAWIEKTLNCAIKAEIKNE